MPVRPYVWNGVDTWIGIGSADLPVGSGPNPRDSLVYGDYKPDASTTGPLPGSPITQHGNSSSTTDYIVSADDEIVENLEIWGRVSIGTYNRVIIRNCIIHGSLTRGPNNAAHVIATGDNLRGALIIDCQLIGRSVTVPAGMPLTPAGTTNAANEWNEGMRGGNYTIRRTEIMNVPDGITLNSTVGNVRAEGCWIHNGWMNEWEQEEGSSGGGGNGYYTQSPASVRAAIDITKGSITSNSFVLTTTATASNEIFDANKDLFRPITVYGAGAGGSNLVTRIQSVQSTTSVTLYDKALTTVSAGRYVMPIRYAGLYNHVDGVQFHRGKNYTFIGNRIGGVRVPGDHNAYPSEKNAVNSGDDMYNSAFMIKQEVNNQPVNKIENVVIDKNWLSGGLCTLNITLGKSNYFETVYITNNRFARSTWGAQNYILRMQDTSGVKVGNFSDNVFEDDGTPVPIGNGGTVSNPDA